MIDALVEEGKLREGALSFAREAIDEGLPLGRCATSTTKLRPRAASRKSLTAIRKANAKKFRGFEAWERAIDAVRDAVELPFDEGHEARARGLPGAARDSTQSKAQRHVFFAERQVWKIADVPDDTPTLPIDKVGVIGAGTMGGGISMNFLNAGIPVTIVETQQAALDRGLGVIRKNYENTAKKGRMTAADVETRMELLTGTLDLNRARRLRSHHRGGVRGHGDQEGHFRAGST